MQTSEDIKELAAALAKAQGQMTFAVKDAVNPHFKSRYSDLASVWEACRKPLTDNGLSVIQGAACHDNVVVIDSMLLHSSGQWIKCVLTLEAKDPYPQAIGSAITYGRRYLLSAMVGIAPDDDDGEAAQGRTRIDAKDKVALVPVNVIDARVPVQSILSAFAAKGVSAAAVQSRIIGGLANATPEDLELLRVWLRELSNPPKADPAAATLTQMFKTPS